MPKLAGAKSLPMRYNFALLWSLTITAIQPSSTPESPDSAGVFSLPQFRWLFAGNVAFFFAMQGQLLTRSLLAWEITGEATALAWVNLVVAIPMIFASVVGGAITDRVERGRLIIMGQSLIAANEFFMLFLLFTDQLQFWHMLCTAFVAGLAFPFIMPARMAITASVVGPKRIQSAMAYSGGVMNLSRVLGPAFMGLLIGQYSFIVAYIVSATLYCAAIMCMFKIDPSRSKPASEQKPALLTDIVGGFTYLSRNRPVLTCLLFGLIPMFLAMPFQNILVVLADEAWQVGESGVGILMAAGGCGGVIGALWIVKRGDSRGRLTLMLWTTVAFGVFLAIFAKTNNFLLALLPLFLANICMSASQTVNNAAIQILVEDGMRGRMSSFMMLSYGLTPIGVFPMAIAADRIGASNAIVIACVTLVIAVVLFYLFSTHLRSLDRNVSEVLSAS